MSSNALKLKLFSLAVGLASSSTIALEIMLTRVFSVTMYYHFAFMVIALALLGMAVAGVTVYVLPRWFSQERASRCMALGMACFAVGSLMALTVALNNPVHPHRWSDSMWSLLGVYAAALIPFVAAGFTLTLAIREAGPNIGVVYAADLGGAALGCLFVVWALSELGAPGAIAMNAALALVSSVLFLWVERKPQLSLGWARAGSSLAAAAAALCVYLAASDSKEHRFGQAHNPGKFSANRSVLFEKWNAFSQVTVTPAEADDHRWIFIDADAATRLWSADIARDFRRARRESEVRVAALGHALGRSGTSLVIGPGGGTDILSALHDGAARVIGVELNPIIVHDVMLDQFATFSGGIYGDPRVEIVVDDARSFIRRSGSRFKVIQATLVDTWAASSSGAFALSENNLYTVEAFGEFLRHLEPDGVLVVTRWYDARLPREFLRLVLLARAALEAEGVAPGAVRQHLYVAGDGGRRATLLVKKQPFSPAELTELRQRVQRDRLRVLYAPGRDELAHRDGALAQPIESPDLESALANFHYDLSPPRDDRPFFFYTLRTADVVKMLLNPGQVELNNLGVILLLTVLVASVVATLAFVLLPLLLLRSGMFRVERSAKLRALTYFLALGLGFILVEIGLMQRFVLFLGHPVYSLTVVLASLLLSSGLGSALSGLGARRWGTGGFILRIVGVLAVVLMGYSLVLTPLFHAWLGLSLGVRIALAIVLVAVPGVLMGTLLPSGVRLARALDEDLVPWAWALNGAASVVGSVLAVFVSMNAGFTLALMAGIFSYASGAALVPRAALLQSGRQAA